MSFNLKYHVFGISFVKIKSVTVINFIYSIIRGKIYKQKICGRQPRKMIYLKLKRGSKVILVCTCAAQNYRSAVDTKI